MEFGFYEKKMGFKVMLVMVVLVGGMVLKVEWQTIHWL